jgi:hypothetical protein
MSVESGQADVPSSRCAACGMALSADTLKRASLPSLNALAVAGLAEPDDPDLIPWSDLTDQRWYCRECRSRLHRRRALGVMILVAMAALLALVLSQWLR